MKTKHLFNLATFLLALSARLPALAVDTSSAEQVKPALPKIPAKTFLLTDFGAIADGKSLNTEAFKRAISSIDSAGGGKLVVPKGTFVTAPFVLCSKLDLHLDEGAVIQAPDNFAALGIADPATLHSQAEVKANYKVPAPLIIGNNLHDVSITGTGIIDGSGAHWWAWSERAERAQPGRLVYRRPHLVVIRGCKRLLIADITLRNSSMFHLVPSNIEDLTIERVKVRAPHDAPNTDAIDPGPVTRAWIHDCDIDTGDDDIVMKSGGTDVLIENCHIGHGHGISIGSETVAGIHNMLVRHCTFDGTDNGIRIKSMIGKGGPVENVRYTDIHMKHVDNVITFDLNYVDNNVPDYKGDADKTPSITNILIDNITAEDCKNAGKFVGLPNSKITGVTIRNAKISAVNDFVIKDADKPILENAVITLAPNPKAGVPDKTKIE